MKKFFVDSQLSPEEAIAQNPASLCPEDIFSNLTLVEVTYLSFDKRLHLGQLVVDERVSADVKGFFAQALELGFPIARAVPASDSRYAWDDEKMMADNNSSGFNYRTIAGTDELSKHSRGLAIDINPVQNPYIRYTEEGEIVQPPHAVWDPKIGGSLHDDHPLVRFMEARGWEWGGNWTPESGRVDYQHFEIA